MKKVFVFSFILLICSPIQAHSWLSRIANSSRKASISLMSPETPANALLNNLSKEIAAQHPARQALSQMTTAERGMVLSAVEPLALHKGIVSQDLLSIEKTLRRSAVEYQAELLKEFKNNPDSFLKEVRYTVVDNLKELDLTVPHKVIFMQATGKGTDINQVSQMFLAQMQMKDGILFTDNVAMSANRIFKYTGTPSDYHKILSPFSNIPKDVLAGKWDKQSLFSDGAVDILNDFNFKIQRIDLTKYFSVVRTIAGPEKGELLFSQIGKREISFHTARYMQSVLNGPEAVRRIFVLNGQDNFLPVLLNHPNNIAQYFPKEQTAVLLFSNEEQPIDTYLRKTGGVPLPEGKYVVREARGKAARLLGADWLIWIR